MSEEHNSTEPSLTHEVHITPDSHDIRDGLGELIRRFDVYAIPETGRVLFVLHVSDEALAYDAGETEVADIWRIAQQLAPDRCHVAVMTSGLTLDVLTDDQLEPLGLQRIPPA